MQGLDPADSSWMHASERPPHGERTRNAKTRSALKTCHTRWNSSEDALRMEDLATLPMPYAVRIRSQRRQTDLLHDPLAMAAATRSS